MDSEQLIADFRADGRTDMEKKLEIAVGAAQKQALVTGTAGVLVTRHDFYHYSVALSLQVPYGLTREHDQIVRN